MDRTVSTVVGDMGGELPCVPIVLSACEPLLVKAVVKRSVRIARMRSGVTTAVGQRLTLTTHVHALSGWLLRSTPSPVLNVERSTRSSVTENPSFAGPVGSLRPTMPVPSVALVRVARQSGARPVRASDAPTQCEARQTPLGRVASRSTTQAIDRSEPTVPDGRMATSWNTGWSGKRLTGLFRLRRSSITSTVTLSITALKTSWRCRTRSIASFTTQATNSAMSTFRTGTPRSHGFAPGLPS